MDQPTQNVPVHGSCIACQDRGLLITGASGTGKSSLALQLIALGAGLVADDRVELTRDGKHLIATCPAQLSNMIEARGIGILNVTALGPIRLHAVVSLDHTEVERIPPQRQISLLDVRLPLLHKVDMPSFPAALLQYLISGTHDGTPQ